MADDFFDEKEIVKFTFSNRYYLTGPFRFIAGIFMVWWPNGSHYTLTNQRLKIRLGWLSKRLDEIELFRIKDAEFKANMFERMWRVGTLKIVSSQQTDKVLVIKGIPNGEKIREDIRRYVMLARKNQRTTELDAFNDSSMSSSMHAI